MKKVILLCTICFLTIVKLYAQTNFSFQWAKSIGGSTLSIGKSEGYAIKEDAIGNTYVAATFSNTMDFDPTNNTYYSTAAGYDLFLSKYDPSGNFLWVKTFTLNTGSGILPQEMEINASGEVYMYGVFYGTVDFDPSASTAIKTGPGSDDIFISKFDSNGNLMWVNTFGSATQDRGISFILDAAGDLYTTGYYTGTVDFDPSAATQNLTSVGNSIDIFIAKYNSSGNFVWVKSMGGTSTDQPKKITIDSNNDILISGDFQSPTVDFDPSVGVSNLSLIGVINAFYAKYDINGNYIFAKNFGSSSMVTANSVTADAFNNIFVTGYFTTICDFDPSASTNTLAVLGAQDIYIAKYNNLGNFVWVKQIAGTSNEIASEIETDANNNLYIAARFTGTCDFDPSASVSNAISAGSSDICVAKYDLNGNYIFARNFGSTVTGTPYIGDLDVKPSGNFNIAGSFYGNVDFDPSPTSTNILASLIASLTPAYFMAKYDSNGNYISAFTGTQKKGGVDEANSIVTDAAGNVYVAGYFNGTVDFDPSPVQNSLVSKGLEDIFIAKYSSTGNYLWAKNIGGTTNDRANSIKLDASGNIYITGFASSADFDPSPATYTVGGGYFAKYDNSGNFLMANSLGGSAGNAITVDVSGNIYITGYYTGTCDFDPSASVFNLTSAGLEDVFVAKYNSLGNLMWAISNGGINSEIAYDICVSSAGSVYITGFFQGTADFNPTASVFNITSNGLNDVFYAQYNNLGGLVFAKSVGGTGNDYGYSIALDNSLRVYVAGQFSGTADFDPGAATYNLVSNGFADAFVARFDSFGSFGSFGLVGNYGGTSTDLCKDMYVDANNNIFITGYFTGIADFDPTGAVYNIASNGSTDIFIAMLNSSPIGIGWAKAIGGSGTEYSNAMAVLNYNDIYIGGTHLGITDFDPSVATYTLLSEQSTTDLYVAKYNQCTSPSLPTINYYNTNPICSGLTATLTVGSAQLNSATQWQWYTGSCGGTPIATGATLNVVPVNNTTYFVRGEGGCISTPSLCASTTISVTASPTLVVNTSSTTICSGATTTLTSNGATSYTWNTGATSNSIVVSPNVSTSYSVIGGVGTCSSSASQTITINALPTLTISGISNLCIGQTTSLNVTGANSYTWNASVVSPSILVTPSITTNYVVSGIDINGCLNSSTKTVTVNALPLINIAGSNTVCVGNSIVLNATGANTYTWSTGANSNTILVTPSSNSTYSVSGTSLAGCLSSSISVLSLSVIPLPTVTVNGLNTICSGNNTTLSAAGASTYTWSTGANTSTISVAPTSSIVYSVSGSLSGCSSSSSLFTLNVNPLPIISYVQSPTLVCVTSASLALSSASPVGGIYTGSFVTGSVFNVSSAPVGTYSIAYSYTDANNCSNYSTSYISVSLCTNISSIANENEVNIYPNPTKYTLAIELNQELFIGNRIETNVYNLLGQKIVSIDLNKDLDNKIDLLNIPDGIYHLKMETSKGLLVKKIIKENN